MYETVKSNVAIGVVCDAKAKKIKSDIDEMLIRAQEILSEQRKGIIGYNLSAADEDLLLSEVKKEFQDWLN